MSRIPLLIVPVGFLLACGAGSPGSTAGDRASTTPDGGSTTWVPQYVLENVVYGDRDAGCEFRVHATYTYRRDGAQVTEPELFEFGHLRLFLDVDGGWEEVPWPGSDRAPGASILCRPNAPGMTFLLLDERSREFEFDDSNWGGSGGAAIEGIFRGPLSIDLSHALVVRPDRAPGPTAPGTSIAYDFKGLVPSIYTSVFLYSPEAGVNNWFPLTDGGELAGSFDYASQYNAPIDASQGDTSYVVQQEQVALTDGEETAVTRVADVSGFSTASGEQVALDATLAPVPLDRSLSVGVDVPGFKAAADPISPLPTYMTFPEIVATWFPIALGPQRVWSAHRFFDDSATVPESYELAWAHWLPETEDELYVSYDRLLSFDGGTVGEGRISAELSPDALPSPISPQVGPVQGIRINGLDADVAQEGVGASPELSWTPPELGTPVEYRVSLHTIDQSCWCGYGIPIYTGLTHLRLPPDLLVDGYTYVATITAFVSGSRRSPAQPLLKTLPEYRADAVTAPFTP